MLKAGILAFLKRHPVVCLLLLTPGIPEYLSSSSPLNALIINPFMFVFQLAANLGLYGTGVLLVREAMMRWKKGWGTVLLLGAAYGILEEGVALSSLFNSGAGPVGELGSYGHWLGVNWVWLAGITPVHMIYSISIPILLLGVALPATRGQPFLTRRKLVAALAILGADVSALFVLVVLGAKFWMGWPVVVGSSLTIGVLMLAARRVKPDALQARTVTPKARPRKLALVGVLFFPSVLFSQFLPKAAGSPPILDFFWVVAVQAIFLAYVLRVAGSKDNERGLVAFAFGLVVPIAAVGLIAEISLPVTLITDILMVLFFRKLWQVAGRNASPITPVSAAAVFPER